MVSLRDLGRATAGAFLVAAIIVYLKVEPLFRRLSGTGDE